MCAIKIESCGTFGFSFSLSLRRRLLGGKNLLVASLVGLRKTSERLVSDDAKKKEAPASASAAAAAAAVTSAANAMALLTQKAPLLALQQALLQGSPLILGWFSHGHEVLFEPAEKTRSTRWNLERDADWGSPMAAVTSFSPKLEIFLIGFYRVCHRVGARFW